MSRMTLETLTLYTMSILLAGCSVMVPVEMGDNSARTVVTDSAAGRTATNAAAKIEACDQKLGLSAVVEHHSQPGDVGGLRIHPNSSVNISCLPLHLSANSYASIPTTRVTHPQLPTKQPLSSPPVQHSTRPTPAAARQAFSTVSIPFVPNTGQYDERVGYSASILAGTVFVTKDGQIVYSLPASKDTKTKASGWSLAESFLGGQAAPAAGAEAVTRVSRFVGSDPQGWQSNVATYHEVTLGEVWDGIDVRLAVRGSNVEKIYTVAPGAEASSIRMDMSGANRLELGEDGALIAETGLGPVSFSAPIAYQEIDGKRRPVQVAYAVKGSGYGFEVGDYERSYPLIIDPILQSTYLGGSTGPGGFGDIISDIAIHPTTGEVYVVGRTGTTDFPGTAGGAQPVYTTGFTFVARLNADLTSLRQATYYGSSSGGAANQSFVIAVTETNVYISGRASMFDLPGSAGGAIPTSTNNIPGFVARLSSSLTSITQATYITSASSGFTEVNDMVVHPNGDVYILGYTNVPSLPNTAGAFQPGLSGTSDAFVMRLNGALTAIVRSSFLGGSGVEVALNLGVSTSTGDLYVGGWTNSLTSFPGVGGGAQPTASGNSAGFVSRINADLTALLQSTYVDGNGSDDTVQGLAVHPQNGNIYIAGYGSAGLPAISGGAQTVASQVFVARLNAGLTAFVQSTFFGTTEQFWPDGNRTHPITVHPVSGEIYLIGITLSTNLPGASGGAQATRSGGVDGFVTRFNAGLTQVLQSTYLGGSTNSDFPYAITVHPGTGDIYVVGEAQSADFPGTAGGAQPVRNGGQDGFIARITANLAAAWPSTLTVNCPAASIQSAVDMALPGTTISVTGICNENVLIRNEKQRITLDGGGTATVNGTNLGSPALNIRGKGVLVQNFAGITGGSSGVYVNRGSNAVINSNTIHNTAGNGVIVDELAFAVLTNNTIENNPGAGIFVSENSTARIGFNSDSDIVTSGNRIQTNGAGGILVSNGSSARIIGNAIQSNTGEGILVIRDSQADIASNVLDNNAGDGIEVGENSSVQLGEDSGASIYETPNSTSTNNTGFGIRCTHGGVADGRIGGLTGGGGVKHFADFTCIDSLSP